jgi:hypothetical protein
VLDDYDSREDDRFGGVRPLCPCCLATEARSYRFPTWRDDQSIAAAGVSSSTIEPSYARIKVTGERLPPAILKLTYR